MIRRRKLFATKEKPSSSTQRSRARGRQYLRPEIDPAISVGAYAWAWLKQLQAKAATLETYAKHLRLYILPALGTLRVRDVRRPRLKSLLGDFLARSHGRASGGR